MIRSSRPLPRTGSSKPSKTPGPASPGSGGGTGATTAQTTTKRDIQQTCRWDCLTGLCAASLTPNPNPGPPAGTPLPAVIRGLVTGPGAGLSWSTQLHTSPYFLWFRQRLASRSRPEWRRHVTPAQKIPTAPPAWLRSPVT